MNILFVIFSNRGLVPFHENKEIKDMVAMLADITKEIKSKSFAKED